MVTMYRDEKGKPTSERKFLTGAVKRARTAVEVAGKDETVPDVQYQRLCRVADQLDDRLADLKGKGKDDEPADDLAADESPPAGDDVGGTT